MHRTYNVREIKLYAVNTEDTKMLFTLERDDINKMNSCLCSGRLDSCLLTCPSFRI